MYVFRTHTQNTLNKNPTKSREWHFFLISLQCLELAADKLAERAVDDIDIAFDDLSRHYKAEEDPKLFQSEKTKRGPLIEGWRDDKPIMCSYKLVDASFEVWGFQTRVEDYIHRCIRDVLLLGHRQAFTWIDEWIDMSLDDVREYERQLQVETNEKLGLGRKSSTASNNQPTTPTESATIVDAAIAADTVPNDTSDSIETNAPNDDAAIEKSA